MKYHRWVILACCASPVIAGAQRVNAATPQAEANPITESIKGFSFFGGWLLAAFDSIPESRYSFRPMPTQQTVGHIAQHLENANYELCARFGAAPRKLTARDSTAETVKAAWPKDTLVTRVRASLTFCRDAILTLTDARLAEVLPANAAVGMREAPRARFVLLFLTDLAEHYSQIANYMRAMEMVPPSALPQD